MSDEAPEPKKRKRTKPVFVARVGNVRVPVYRYADGRFCVAWRQVEGGPQQRETFSLKKDAEARADEVAKALANSLADVLTLSSADRDNYRLAVQTLAPFGVPLFAVVQEWAAARKILGDGHSIIDAATYFKRGKIERVEVPLTSKVVSELLEQIEDRKPSAKYKDGLRRDLERFAGAEPNLEEVDEERLRAYLRGLRSKTGAAVSLRRRDNVRNGLVRLFRFARSRGYLAEDKTSSAEKVERVSHGGDVTTYTPAQLSTLLSSIGSEFLPWAALGGFAGLRTSEIWRLTWEDIRWSQKVIAIRRSVARKVRTARLVPMSENLLAWLSHWRNKTGPIFPNIESHGVGGSWKTLEDRHRRALAKLRDSTGLQTESNALRHSFGSYRLAAVKDIARVALEMGNSPAKIRENYHDPKTEEEALTYFGIHPPWAPPSNVLPITAAK